MYEISYDDTDDDDSEQASDDCIDLAKADPGFGPGWED